MADFFISYNSADKDRATEIASALRDAGFAVRFAEWEVKLGMSIPAWMRQATNDCPRTIAVCSPDYFKPEAKYSGWERDSYLWIDVDGKDSAVIPVLVAKCNIDKLMAGRAYYDLTRNPISGLIDALNGLDGPTLDVDPPPPIRPYLNVPTGRAVIGRDDDLARLQANLEAGQNVTITNAHVLAGQGGVGKSTLARAYAERHHTDYAGVLWVEADTRQKVIEGLMDLCPPLGLDPPETPQEPHAKQVLTALAQSGQRWLLIYDNVEGYQDIDKLLPQTAHLLVTTRQGAGWPGFRLQDTQVLDTATSDGPATALLMAEAKRNDDPDGARALAAHLGGLPLALVVTGALARTGEPWTEIGTELDRILTTAPKNEAYQDSILAAVSLSYERLPEDARRVADILAWWAPDDLHPRLFTDAPDGPNDFEIPEDIADLARDKGRVASAFEALTDRSLLRQDGAGHAMHRMTAAALRALPAGGNLSKGAAALLAAVYPYDSDHSGNWPACRRLTPHVRALWASDAAPETAAMDFALNQASLYLDRIGDVAGQVETAKASLTLKEARLPEDHRDIALGYSNLGMALRGAGDLPGAEQAIRRALELDSKHRPGSLDIAIDENELGRVLEDQGQQIDALRAFQRSALIKRRAAPRLSDTYAIALSNLADTRYRMGQGLAALRLAQGSLRIWREILPPGDARLGFALNNVGSYALRAGAADRAEDLLREGLDVWIAAYQEAPRHAYILGTAGWLATALLVRARAGEAPEARRAEARTLCDTYGHDFAAVEARAQTIPYTPAG